MSRDYTTSIAIPVYKHWDLCHDLLKGILHNEKENVDEILVVDNYSQDIDVDNGIELWKNLLPIKVVKTEWQSGFTIAANIGIRFCEKPVASRHITFLISSDVLIKGKFIQQTADILLGAKRSLVGNKLLFGDTGWNTFDGKTFKYLEGWFLAATSDHWRDIGYFDENYAPYDFEDIDLSTTAQSKGYKLVPLNNPNIIHLGGGTIGYNPQREAVTKRNREYFREKWMK